MFIVHICIILFNGVLVISYIKLKQTTYKKVFQIICFYLTAMRPNVVVNLPLLGVGPKPSMIKVYTDYI